MNKKIKLGILFGGRSAEHEVSLQSAKNVIEAADKEKYELILIGIDKNGKWYLLPEENYLKNADNPSLISLNLENAENAALIPNEGKTTLYSICSQKHITEIDVIFPVLHGTYGEDGTIQGLLRVSDIPFAGADVLGSAVGMDKDVMKRLLRDAELPMGRFLTVHSYEKGKISFSGASEYLGMPMFIKPANLGSSVGIHKIHNESEFYTAVEDAFLYDNKIVIEEFIKGREIECSVLGNENPEASLPGEVVPRHEFYSYEAKYIDDAGADLLVPADLPEDIILRIQELAVTSYKVLCCSGMARADFFLTDENEILINEINTIPGFTRISMYPKLWGASGIPYSQLIDRLIELALERDKSLKRLKTSF